MNNLKAGFLRRYFGVAIFKLLVFAPFNVFGQLTPVTTKVDGACGGYWEFLPSDYSTNPTKRYPVIFFLHGLGELGSGSSTDLKKLLIYGPTKLIHTGKWPPYFTVKGQNYEVIVITPQFKAWPVDSDVNKVINYAVAKYRIDTTRMYITGLSMGGGATWEYVADSISYAKRIAAIVPVSGASYPSPEKAAVMAATNLPVWALHNLNDPTVPTFYSVDYVKYLNSYVPAINPKALLTIFQASGHDSWDSAYNLNYTRNGLNVFQWMLQYSRGVSAPPPPTRQQPVSNPGLNETLILPKDSTILNGASSTDPAAPITAFDWTQLSGPSNAQIRNPESSITELSELQTGSYQFKLTVVDSLGDSSSASVTIIVNPATASAPPDSGSVPVANPGVGITLTLPLDSTILNGSGSTDSSGHISSYEWTQVSGPSTAQIHNPESSITELSELQTGSYQFKLTVVDSLGDSSSASVTIIVNPATASAPPDSGSVPVANPGVGITLTLPLDSTILNGSGSTDSSGHISSYEWTQVSGPSTAQISSPDSAITAVSKLSAGQYVFSLLVKDSDGDSSLGTVTITLNNAAAPPDTSSSATANDNINPYTGEFLYGTNPGYYANSWTDELLGTIAKADGINTERLSLSDAFIAQWGVDIRLSAFAYYQDPLNLRDNTLFLNQPRTAYQDTTTYPGSTQRSLTFANLYQPVWNTDGSLDTNNYYAHYVYNIVSTYGQSIKFWEVWNEPDINNSPYVYSQPGQTGNWYNNPPPVGNLYGFYAPVYSYIRMLRITYEIVHKLYPNEYVCTGGIGYPSFLDALLRYTDNPDSGKVTPQYPLKGGAYIDVISYHCYPEYGLRYWTNAHGGEFVNTRTSDYAANYVIGLKDSFQVVLQKYHYDGTSYPQKPYIVTETNIARKQFSNYIGSDVAQRNFAIKVLIQAQKYKIGQLYFFSLGESANYDNATSEFQLMGLYQNLTNESYGSQQLTQEGEAVKTTSEILLGYTYDPVRSGELNLPNRVDGAAFSKSGNYIYVLWAKCLVDENETATATYSFPVSLGINSLTQYGWDYSVNSGDTMLINSQNITLGGTPVFLTQNPSLITQGPVANAGSNITLTQPVNSTELVGSGSTDQSGTIVHYSWTKIDGPQFFNIASPNSANTAITGLTLGVYTFALTVTDNNGDSAIADVIVTENSTGNPAFQPPVAMAGSNITITLPVSTASVNGSGSYSPEGKIVGYDWSQVSGPGTGSISSPDSDKTNITNLLQPGVYEFTLTVTDNMGATAVTQVTVTVNEAANESPLANAGPNITITLPLDSTLLNGSASTDPGGTLSSYNWSQVSGPSSAQIGSSGAMQTSIDGMQAGTYIFSLTIKDNHGASSSAQIVVTVNPAPTIHPPVANAGQDTTLILPTDSLVLNAGGSADAGGTITAYTWTMSSGPGGSLIGSPDSVITKVSDLSKGKYVFVLNVTDNQGLSSKDSVNVIVNPAADQPPTANAGNNITITLPLDTVELNGSGSTDTGGQIASYQWTQISGPSHAAFTQANAIQTGADSLVQGVYEFQLQVTDTAGATSDSKVTVTVNAAANQAPIANAGNNQNITLPIDSLVLNGSASYDPGGYIAKYSWTEISGPATYHIASPDSSITSLDSLVAGNYVFQLTVWDNSGASSSTQVQVSVNPAAHIPPVANAGPNITLTLPADSTTLNGSTSLDTDGTITSYSWVKISGPAAYTLSDANTANAQVNNLSAGTYTFSLTVTDNFGYSSTASVTVTVNFPPAGSLVASAGSDITLTLPLDSTTLDGTGSYDTDGTIVSYSWTQIGGPSTYTLTGSNTVKSELGNLAVGNYEFELTVKDNNGLTSNATVSVTVVQAAHIPPVAEAGANITLNLPLNTTTLDGSGSYDTDGTITSFSWSNVSGPYGYSISGANNAKATLSNLVAGTYVFELTVTDNAGYSASSEVTVRVDASSHMPPVAVAGSGITITLPDNTATLNGSSSYDTDGTIVTYSWSQVSGPDTYVISDANSASGQLSNLGEGTYVFELTVKDNDSASSTVEITVTVNPAPHSPPVADAGSAVTITLPTNSVTLNGSSSYDMDGTIVSYSWSQVSGPAGFTISGANSTATQIGNLSAGTYVFELTVKDNDSASSTAQVTVTVNPDPHAPPVAIVNPDISVTLPADSANLDGSNSFDTDGQITTFSWTELSGPSSYTLVGSGSALSYLSGLVVGTYVFELTVTDNFGSSSTATVTVTVNPQPDVPPVANAGDDTTITFPADTVYLNGSASYSPVGTIVHYHWQEVAGPTQFQISDSESAQTMVSGLVAGNYLFTLTVTDNNGLQATSQVEVTVNLNANVANGQVVIYPNPAINEATVYFYNNQAGKVVVNLYDLMGRLQESYNFVKDHQAIFKEIINLTGLPSGIYFVQVSINGSFSTTQKLEKLQN